METMDFADLFSELVRFETELWDAIDKRLRAEHDLPLTHFEPMQIIARTPQCRVNDIAEALSITVGGTSKLVDRIEAVGLCRRRPNPNDGRSSQIELTDAGWSLLHQATVTFTTEVERLLGPTVPRKTLQQFAATLQKLRQGLRG